MGTSYFSRAACSVGTTPNQRPTVAICTYMAVRWQDDEWPPGQNRLKTQSRRRIRSTAPRAGNGQMAPIEGQTNCLFPELLPPPPRVLRDKPTPGARRLPSRPLRRTEKSASIAYGSGRHSISFAESFRVDLQSPLNQPFCWNSQPRASTSNTANRSAGTRNVTDRLPLCLTRPYSDCL